MPKFGITNLCKSGKGRRVLTVYEINLKIHDEKDLYSPYDENCLTLNDDVADYLAGQYNKKDIGDDEIIIKIKCDGPVEFERVRDAFQELIREQRIRTANQKRLNRIKQLWLFSVGFIFVAAAILLEGILDAVPVELISIVGSFAVWEATNIWIVQNPRTRLAKRTMQKLNSTKIVIEQPNRA